MIRQDLLVSMKSFSMLQPPCWRRLPTSEAKKSSGKAAPNTAPLRGTFGAHPRQGVHYAQASSVKAAGQGPAGGER